MNFPGAANRPFHTDPTDRFTGNPTDHLTGYPTDRFGDCSKDQLPPTIFGSKCDEKLEFLQLTFS